MIVCPCGMTIEQETVWPPYRFVFYNENKEIEYALCIHNIVVIDKRNAKDARVIEKLED